MYTNYYNPYMFNRISNKKRFSFKNLDFNKILTNTSKTLGVIKEAIPVYYQVKPIISNAKTLFRVANIIKEDSIVDDTVATLANNTDSLSNNPTFFL